MKGLRIFREMIVNLKICLIFDANFKQHKHDGNGCIFRFFGIFDHFHHGILDVDLLVDLRCSLLAVWKFNGELEVEKG